MVAIYKCDDDGISKMLAFRFDLQKRFTRFLEQSEVTLVAFCDTFPGSVDFADLELGRAPNSNK
jgi:hypothetical protein